MNIKEAKIQIQNAMTAYFTKDEYGRYAIPIEQQRPVFLMGPPGIGKARWDCRILSGSATAARNTRSRSTR